MTLTQPRPGELAWQAKARCLEKPTEIFFPERGGSSAAARAICSECPVRRECLDYALRNREQFGIWGGTGERERRKLRRSGQVYTVRDVVPAAPFREALRRIAKESFVTSRSPAVIRPLTRHIAENSDVTWRAVESFIQDDYAREIVSLNWVAKVCTALGRPDLPSQLWPEATEVAA